MSQCPFPTRITITPQAPPNNLGVIQLDGGHFLLAFTIIRFAVLPALVLLSFLQAMSCLNCLPLLFIFNTVTCFSPFFLPDATWSSLEPQLVHHFCLASPYFLYSIDKGRKERENRKREGMPTEDQPRTTHPTPSPTHSLTALYLSNHSNNNHNTNRTLSQMDLLSA